MAKKIFVGIDIGSFETRVIIFERTKEGVPLFLGAGTSLTRGVRHGFIVNAEQCKLSLQKAITQTETETGIRIKKASLSIGGAHLSSVIAVGSTIVSKADNEITERDIENAIAEAEKEIPLTNQKLLDALPIQYKVDGKISFGSPLGMKGIKLEVKTLFCLAQSKHIDALMSICSDIGIDIVDVIPAVINESHLVVNEQQRIAGTLIMNIGAESTTLGVYENSSLVSLTSFPLGGRDITNDIALVLKISLEEAEGIKIGSVITGIPKKKIDDIITARLYDIFEAAELQLKKIRRSGLLPAGVILTGGTSYLPGLDDYAKNFLKIPARVAVHEVIVHNTKMNTKHLAWLPLYGLLAQPKRAHAYETYDSNFGLSVKKIKEWFVSFVKQLLP